jgi:hypothetical protein
VLYFVSFAVIIIGLAIYSTTPTSLQNSGENDTSPDIQEQEVEYKTSPELSKRESDFATSLENSSQDKKRTLHSVIA